MKFALLMLFTFTLEAHETKVSDGKITCASHLGSFGSEGLEELQENIEKIINRKQWQAATDNMVANANCKKPIPSVQQMKDEIQALRDDRDGGSINAFKLPSEDQDLIKHFKEMVSSKDLDSKVDLQDPKFSHCRDVSCLSQAVFGEQRGIKFLYMILKYGLNPSHHVFKNSRPWNKDEIDPFFQGVLDYPKHLFPMNTNKQFTHDKGHEGDTYANSSVRVFGAADSLSDEAKEYTAFHELAHYVAGELKIDTEPQWLKLSGWHVDQDKKIEIEESYKKEITEPEEEFGLSDFSFDLTPKPSNSFTSAQDFYEENNQDLTSQLEQNMIDMQVHYTAMSTSMPDKIISKYGETNPSEDFAESMAAYRFNPQGLLDSNPEKYQFLKEKVFSGQEYLSPEDCK
ncbi:MAG: hypothetical protein KC478_12330 [Bacteriovoracaceae bacterium]|nr:hypothetical protein [Bacteriovoracaceae bacterium]